MAYIVIVSYLQVIEDILFYNDTLSVTLNNLIKVSKTTADLNEDDVAMYAWIVDGGGDNGLAWLGTACKIGSGRKSKTSICRGPSRQNAIIETAEAGFYFLGFSYGRPLLYSIYTLNKL